MGHDGHRIDHTSIVHNIQLGTKAILIAMVGLVLAYWSPFQ